MRISLAVIFLSLTVLAANETKCPANKKFIKSYRYIEGLRNVNLTKKEITWFATEISSRCHNTFERFDRVFEITEKTDLSVKASIILSIRIALDGDINVDNLHRIFKFLINPKGPDLQYAMAMRFAEEFARRGPYSFDLLKEIYGFCMKKKEIPYTRMQCVELSGKVADLGIKKNSIFPDAYTYFSGNRYLNFNALKSIEMTLKVLKFGEKSFEDFKKLFEFALSKRGVNLSRGEAIDLAMEVLTRAELTPGAKKELEKEKMESKERN